MTEKDSVLTPLVYVNTKKRGLFTILAICDVDVLGKTLKEGKIVLEVSEEFYKGFKMSIDEAFALIRQSAIVNMTGQCVIDRALKDGIVHPDAILTVSGVPHAQLMKMF